MISLVETTTRYPGQLCLPLVDTLSPSGVPDRAQLEAFLGEAHAAVERGPTYWHCRRGINRSGLALAAYLHLYGRQSITAAVARLRRLRSPVVLQNETFVAALDAWYRGPDEAPIERVDMEAVARALGVAVVPRHLRQPLPMPDGEGSVDPIELRLDDRA
ncbi:MAG: dual specificity protein phosphatase family protein [Myxococcales bacterium]|nr:dual specificity protein phosphatase family protein [Myxococcales bacterium]